MRGRRGADSVLVERSKEKRPLGRPRRIREDNIKWVFRTWGWEDWIGLIWLKIGKGDGRL